MHNIQDRPYAGAQGQPFSLNDERDKLSRCRKSAVAASAKRAGPVEEKG